MTNYDKAQSCIKNATWCDHPEERISHFALTLAQRMDDARAELALFTGTADSYEHLERACALLEPDE